MEVNKFISRMNKSGGLAKPNRYKVTIIPPQILANIYNLSPLFAKLSTVITNVLSNQAMANRYFAMFKVDPLAMIENLEIYCDAVTLPGMLFSSTESRTYGATWKEPYEPTFGDVNMSFYCGENMKERLFFDAWMYMIRDPITNDFSYNKEFSTQITIEKYSDNDKKKYGVRLIDAWPISYTAQELSYSADNQIMKLNVQFAYKRWLNMSAYDTVLNDVGQIMQGINPATSIPLYGDGD